MKKWKKQFSSRRVSHRSHKKYVAAAVVCILGGSLLFPPTQFMAYAGMKTVTYNLSQFLGIQKDLSPYRTVLGESITKDGYTVTLNEVILDENILYVSDTFTLPQKDELLLKHNLLLLQMLTSLLMVKWFPGVPAAKRNLQMTITLFLTEELLSDNLDSSQNLDIELGYSMYGQSFGSFSFAATGKDLMASTYTTSLDTKIMLPDNTSIHFYKYSSNTMEHRIWGKTSTPERQFLTMIFS